MAAQAALTAPPVAAPPVARAAIRTPQAQVWQNASLALLVFSGFLAIIEPSPYEVMFVIAAVVFGLTGLRLHPAMAPLIAGVLVFNVGGAFSLIPFLDFRDSVFFVVISFYMGLTAIFFAAVTFERTKERLELIRNAWIVAASVSSLCGIMGYFDIGGLYDTLTKYGRATSTFKDPNVFGPFVSVALVLLFEKYIEGGAKRRVLNLLAMILMLAGVFLSFSRGAWGFAILGLLTSSAITFAVTREARIRRRIVLLLCAGAALFVVLLSVALSIESISSLFAQRFVLVQDYDGGVQGRFGKLTGAISDLLDNPNGFGPLKFETRYFEAPHNVFVNAFASYGWIGGIAYLALMVSTMWVGWSTVAIRTPWQNLYNTFWALTFWQIVQGVQIDTDHWRHFWLLIGLTWGAGCASRYHEVRMRTRAKA